MLVGAMFPLRDENPLVHTPFAVILLIGLNAASWSWLQGFGSELPLVNSLCAYGLIPAELLGTAPVGTSIDLGRGSCVLENAGSSRTLVTSMFMHGGWFHLLGNLWFLWVFGDNVEDVMGPGRFVVFYLLCGLAAAAVQVATDTSSTLPMVGASGAIGGVMGAYARLYPRARVDMLLVLGFFFTTVSIPAIMVLGYWFLLQILGGLPGLAETGGGVAFWAHVGGFVAGIAAVGPFTSESRLAAHRAQYTPSRAKHLF